MKNVLAGAALSAAALGFATAAFAVGPPYLEDRPAPSITAPAAGVATDCQKTITKATQKYVKTYLTTRFKCFSSAGDDYTGCPNADDDTKIQETAIKSSESIAGACGDTTGLGSSYNGATAANIASCTLSQNEASLKVYVGETNGAPGEPTGSVATVDCQTAINKAAGKLVPANLKNADKCITNQIKAGVTSNLGAICAGSSTPSGFVYPTDLKTSNAYHKNLQKAWDTMEAACETIGAANIAAIFGCPLASTVNDLDQCMEATAFNVVNDLVTQQWAETGSIVSGTIQSAVDAGSSGDKFLIPSGDYAEGVTLPAATCSVTGGACPGDKKCSAVSKHAGVACAVDEDCEGTCNSSSGNSGDACRTTADCTGECDVASGNPGTECTANSQCTGTCGPSATSPGASCTDDSGCTGDVCQHNGTCSPGACQVGTCDDACPDNTCGVLASNAGAACLTNGDCSGDTCNSGTAPSNVCTSEGDNMQFVGCGAATDDRPRVLPPSVSPPNRGFLAAGVDGLKFQGVEVIGWANDGIFVSGANGVSFRDIFGDGDDLSTANVDAVSTYAIFPVQSTNVVVEASEVQNVRDAGIYVGQCQGVVMRHNLVHGCVSGMELENSKNGFVYGNVTHNNTGGLLVFKLPGPEHQVSGGHDIFENVSYSNDVPNFGIPGTTVSAVPRGTGMMIISEDNSTIENNIVDQNDQYGILVLDQQAINILDPGVFDTTSLDQDSSNLHFLNNRLVVHSNGQGPYDPGTLFAGNWTWAINTPPNGTCWAPAPTANASATLANTTFPACP